MPNELETVELGRALQVRRAQLGMKRRELADRALLSYPYVSEIENGAKTPSAKALRQLAEALRLTPAELMARADLPSSDEVSPEDMWSTSSEPRTQPGNSPRSFDRASPMPDKTADLGSAGILAPARPSGNRPSPPDSPISMPEGLLERWIRDLVRSIIRAELAAWQANDLPELLKQECRQAIDDQARTLSPRSQPVTRA